MPCMTEKKQPKRRGRPAKAMPDSPSTVDIPVLSVHQQIGVLQKLNLQTVAWLLGLTSARTLTQNMRLERNQDGTVDARKVLEYATTMRYRRTDRPGDVARMQRDQQDQEPVGDGTILDYKRKLESKKLELQLLEAEKKVVSVDMVRDFLLLVASRIKDLGGTLQSQYGRDALLCLNEAIADLEATVKRWEDGLKDSEFEL